ncbi:hypothetical protein CDA63_08990 [Hymenobacter amundsenii]|uniref:Tyr recombinase domain-containing protein n=1 Tax=Hymenobacter amundsenii TaxID=2006685 RepID=A0A246FL82_9BACT|nr:site-specific integrase [Hymenobacter amundsenii]OWP63501.1 hypothetical protein CDA63_08990 [Hymenobacter amundsenii]
MATVSFHLKEPKADKATAIFILLNGDGQRVKIYTGERIAPEQWSKAEQKAKTRGRGIESDTNATINSSLANMAKLLETYYSKQRAVGIIPSPASLRAVVEPQPEEKQERPRPLPDFADYLERIALTRRPATRRSIGTTYNHLVAYEKVTRRSLEYDDLTATFHDGFTRYLLETVGLTDNSLAKQVGILKRFLSDAVNRGRTNKQDFKRWKWGKRDPDILSLTRAELQLLESIELPEGHYLNNVRGLFLLGCYSGLRWSDVVALKPEHDRGDRLVLVTKKTSQQVTIPLHPKARPLLDMLWAGRLHAILNQPFNRFIKELCKRAGIDTPTERNSYRGGQRITTTVPRWQLITSHCMRKSFITLALESGLPWDVIMRVSGHTDFRSFRRYVHTTDARQVTEFARVWAQESADTQEA